MKLTERTYGIEIEFLYKSGMSNSAQKDEITNALEQAGINISHNHGYSHTDSATQWKLIDDASAGHELVSPILRGEAGFKQIETVCSILNSLNYKVDKSCGFHVHHGARDLTSKQITAVFASAMKWESVIDRLVAPSRRNNQYCQSNNVYGHDEYALKSALKRLNRDGARNFGHNYNTRYLKVNYQAYLRHETIEFRQHQGTLEADKMIWWIIMTQNIVTHAVECGGSYVASAKSISFKRFRDMLGCTGKYIENNPRVLAAAKTMTQRWHTFNVDHIGVYDTTVGL